MKLYYSPGTCSLSPHIILEEGQFTFELEKVDIRAKKTETGQDFTKINPKGYVPALVLDDGTILTEGPAIVQYLADQKPELKLVPPNGTLERYQLQSWLNFISTELHKNFSPLFNKQASEDHKQMALDNLNKRFEWVASELADRLFLTGNDFTVADAYLFVVLRWSTLVSLDLSKWPALMSFLECVAARPAVAKAIKAEGLKT